MWLRCAQVELGDNDLVNTRAQNREDVPCISTRQGRSCTCEDETVYSEAVAQPLSLKQSMLCLIL